MVALDNKPLNQQKCPFAHNNQCQRNHSFAKALINNDVVDAAYFGLIYHEGNDEILRKWNEYKNICQINELDFIFEINASEIVNGSSDTIYKKYFFDRYKIG